LSDRLLVAVQEHRAYVKPVGRATFKLAPALKRFSVSVISKGCRDILFDMSECTTLDSTFMGVLAGIAMWPSNGKSKVHVTLKGLNARTRSMLCTLGLERVMTCCNHGEEVSGHKTAGTDMARSAREIQHDADRTETLETMLKAHENLVRADEENAARFCDVLTYLDQEIRRVDD
jgi:anti-sigma B factor antagonist